MPSIRQGHVISVTIPGKQASPRVVLIMTPKGTKYGIVRDFVVGALSRTNGADHLKTLLLSVALASRVKSLPRHRLPRTA